MDKVVDSEFLQTSWSTRAKYHVSSSWQRYLRCLAGDIGTTTPLTQPLQVITLLGAWRSALCPRGWVSQMVQVLRLSYVPKVLPTMRGIDYNCYRTNQQQPSLSHRLQHEVKSTSTNGQHESVQRNRTWPFQWVLFATLRKSSASCAHLHVLLPAACT